MHTDVSGCFDWQRLGMQPLRWGGPGREPASMATEAPNGGCGSRKNTLCFLWKCANTCVEQTQSHPRCTAVLNKNTINGSRERLQVKYIAAFGKPKALYISALLDNRLLIGFAWTRWEWGFEKGLRREKANSATAPKIVCWHGTKQAELLK